MSNKGGWSTIRKHWAILWKAAAGAMTVVATIVTPPPTAAGTKGIRAFATFVVAVIIGVVLLATTRFKERKHAGPWAAIALVLLTLTVLNYFWYANLTASLTVEWHDHTFVRGSQLRPEIQKVYGSNISEPLAKKLIVDAAGEPKLIWTDESIDSMKNLLCISYLTMVQFIGGCIIATSQVMICNTQSPSLKKPDSKAKKGHSAAA